VRDMQIKQAGHVVPTSGRKTAQLTWAALILNAITWRR